MSTVYPNADGVFDPLTNTFVDAFGVRIRNIHPVDNCIGRGSCAIHNPSDHSMRGFPIMVRGGDAFDAGPIHLERMCPHGVGHPDPDDMVFWVSIHHEEMATHGCDGCCGPTEEDEG